METMTVNRVIIIPTQVSESIREKLRDTHQGAEQVVLYPVSVVNVPDELSDMEQHIHEAVEELPNDREYILLMTGFAYAQMVARDAMKEQGLQFKHLIYDSYKGEHFEW